MKRLLYSPAELAAATGISESAIRAAINATSPSLPPLQAKRIRKPGSKRSQLKITAAAAEAWLDSMKDA